MGNGKKKTRVGTVRRTLKASNVLLAVGLTAKTMPSLQWLKKNVGNHSGESVESVHSLSLFAVEPQGGGGIVDSEAVFRDRCRIGRDWLKAGIDAKTWGTQPSAWVGEA